MGIELVPMETVADRLKAAMDEKGWGQTTLAQKADVTQATIWKILNGKTKKSKYLPDIARTLGKSVEWLEFGTLYTEKALRKDPSQFSSEHGHSLISEDLRPDKHSPSVAPGPSIRGFVPLISWAQAGNWKEITDIHSVGQGEAFIPTTAKVGPLAFALPVREDSMEPEFPEGSIIIVDPDREARHGSYVVARLNEDLEATFKQLVLDGSRKYLKPLNPRYPLLDMDGKKVTICGVVVQMVKEYA